MSKERKHGITPNREEDFPAWYQMVIKASDIAEHSPVKGCMIIKPWGYGIWERIKKYLDGIIKKTGHKNAYFPLFIPLGFFEREAEHVSGFAKECAVVTHHRLEKKGGKLVASGKLEEPYVVRPTSEMIIGEAFSRWVESYRDLPILINQWANVVRWEMRTRTFLRTTEFLWQEGHTAHATKEEAEEETLLMLGEYERFCMDYLAIPGIVGRKTESEKFPGADVTYCVEAMMQDGKALQAGTSHFLGQNFSRASGIRFKDEDGEDKFAWTTSWGMTTRLIGGLIMVHSDDDGLVIPPKVAPSHVVIQPIYREKDRDDVVSYCMKLKEDIEKVIFDGIGIEVVFDDRDKRGGEKKWEWIKKGIPLRAEVGKRDIDSGRLIFFRRDTLEACEVKREDIKALGDILKDIQNDLLKRALEFRKGHTEVCKTREEFYRFFESKVGFVEAFFSGDRDLEDMIKKDLGVSVRVIPKVYEDERGECIFSGKSGSHRMVFAKAY